MSFKSVLLGTSANKNYTHNMSFDNNTTMDFGFLQPLLSQYMLPKSTISVSSKQLVRLAPMPTPSFARMYLQNYARFVKMTDVVPYYESLLSGISFTTPSGVSVKPVQMPVTTNSFLLWNILCLSSCTVYYKIADPSGQDKWRLNNDVDFLKPDVVQRFNGYLKSRLGFDTGVSTNFGPDYVQSDDAIKPMESDYVVVAQGSDNALYLYCFLFSTRAK